MDAVFHTPPRQGPRTPTFPWTGSPPSTVSPTSAASLTPSPGHRVTPPQQLRTHPALTPESVRMRTPGTPASLGHGGGGGHAPTTSTPDRFIADRHAQDASVSRFLLTAADAVVTTPLTRLHVLASDDGAEALGGGAVGGQVLFSEAPSGPVAYDGLFAGSQVSPSPLPERFGGGAVGSSVSAHHPSRDRDAWGGPHPLGRPDTSVTHNEETTSTASDQDEDAHNDHARHHSQASVHVGSPLAISPSGRSFAAAASTHRSTSRRLETHSSARESVQTTFAHWTETSRETSLAAMMMRGSSPSSPASFWRADGSDAWSPGRSGARSAARAVDVVVSGGRGGNDRQRSSSTSLPRGTPTRHTVQPAPARATSVSVSIPSPSLTSSTTTSTLGGGAPPFLETEPYTRRLARALFADAAQTSVLGLHSHRSSQADPEQNECSTDATWREVKGDDTHNSSTTSTATGDDKDGGGGDALRNVSAAHSTNSSLTVAGAGGSASLSSPQRLPQPQSASLHASMREGHRFHSSLGVIYAQNRAANFQSQSFRVIAQTPERILDAADMIDDFYLNLIDWSVQNVLCVALQSAVYLWSAANCGITQLPISRPADAPSSLVCGVQWAPDGRNVSLGFNDGSVEVWDVEAQQVVQTWHDHAQRVGALSWAAGGTAVVATGSKDATICVRDRRDPNAVSALRCHQQEVCGLRWSPNSYHLASGGNDNQVLVWDRRWICADTHGVSRGHGGSHASGCEGAPSPSPFRVNAWGVPASRAAPVLYLNQHTAAVKALAWNPVQTSLLASGGGTDDRTLRFWDTTTGDCVRSLDTGSQVCGILWSRTGTELVSSHGFSMNQLTVWRYPSLRKMVDLTGHTSRVLHLCLSADGEVVVSAAGDETIRFWRCFPPTPTATSAVTASGAASPTRGGARASPASSAHAMSPVSKPDAELPRYGSPDGAATASSPSLVGAGGAFMHSPRSGYGGSPLSGSYMSAFSPRSGGPTGRHGFDSPSLAPDEVALR